MRRQYTLNQISRRLMVLGALFNGEKYYKSKTIHIFLSRKEIRVNKW